MDLPGLVSLILVTAVFSVSGETIIKAELSANGYKGSVTFRQPGPGNSTDVTITGLQSVHWKILPLRVKYDVANRCSILGNINETLTGTSVTTSIPPSNLHDVRLLCGRSIKVTDISLNKTTCGNLEESGEHVTIIAKFQSKIAGFVVFRQLVNSPTSCTSVSANLATVESTPSDNVQSYTWRIYDKEIPSSLSAADGSFCSSLNNVYNPKSVPGAGCSTGSHENCKVGDLSGKLNDIKVGVSMGTQESVSVDLNLPLSGTDKIANKTLVLMKNEQVVTCAKLKVINSKREASVTFSRDGVTGTINFAQPSPFDPTTVTVNLQNLQSQAGGYHVHMWPVPQKNIAGKSVCSGDSVGGHFNPFNIQAPFPSAGTGTDDQCEIGDLSNKYGLLTGKSDINITKVDYNLPLFGRHSIVGRSVAIHKSSGGARWVCASIRPKYAVKKSQARFQHKVIGHILLTQATDDWELDGTQVYVELNYATSTAKTKDHKWHIHVKRIDDKLGVDDPQRCSSVGGHYNPFAVDLMGNYATECKPDNPLRCELGDMSGKHGKLNIRTELKTMWRAFFTDVDLPLSGPESVAARSIVIHDANSGPGRLVCADLYDVVPITAEVNTWASTSVMGTPSDMKFVDDSTGYLEGITNVYIRLSNLNDVDGFHVHAYPVSSNQCHAKAVGGHFNPFNTAGSSKSVTDDQYEVGDLSGKYRHPLLNKSAFNGMFTDTNLPLRGVTSSLGRSVVIHKRNGDRWTCGTIDLNTDASRIKWTYKSEASFLTGNVAGTIKMTQYLFEDGGVSNTEVLVDLKYKSDTTQVTKQHKWHVHVLPVKEDVGSPDCTGTGGHYNPFNVDLINRYDECSKDNPLRCESGDQTGKLGAYDIGGGRRFYTDVSLNLMGPFTVVGRSFVVHSENNGASRIACADIYPNERNPVSYEMKFNTHYSFKRTALRSTLTSALGTWDIHVGIPSFESICTYVNVSFTGPKGTTMREKLDQIIKDESLAMYATCTLAASCSFAGAMLPVLCVVFLQLWL